MRITRRLTIFLVATVAIATATTGASLLAQVGAAASSDVKVVDNVLYEALAARDAKQVDLILDDAFVLTNTFGVLYNKKEFLKGCCEGEPPSKTQYFGTTDAQVKKYGDTAVIVGNTELRFNKDNKDQKLAWRSMRVYVKSGGRWKLVAESRTGY